VLTNETLDRFEKIIFMLEIVNIYIIGKGFVYIATQAQVPIVPTFMANQEEMRWNPILYFWNLVGLGRLFSSIVKLNIPILTSLLNLIASII